MDTGRRVRTGDHFRGRSPSYLYRELLYAVHGDGAEASPRGMPIRELLHVTTEIEEPTERLLLSPRRNLNPFFLVAEAMWILAGRSDAEFITYYNSQLKKFLDKRTNPDRFHAPYGERIRYFGRCDQWSEGGIDYQREELKIDQLASVIKILKEDSDSRRAVITLWHPVLDREPSNDIPCNDAIFFKIRNGKLYMTVCNRSNDLNLGFPSTNVFQFTIIQEALARILKIKLGAYTHYSDSLHLYEDDPITKRVLSVELPGFYEPPVCPFYGMELFDLDDMDHVLRELFKFESKWRTEGGECRIAHTMNEVDRLRIWAGVFGDFLLYMNIYILYKNKEYRAIGECLCRLIDFNLFLGGLEFLRRAIKTPVGQAMIFDKGLDNELDKRLLRQWPGRREDENKRYSAHFFLNGGKSR